MRGSSPLARGLRISVDGVVYKNRIIPARAGFTSTGSTSRLCLRDHPRSRGVYCQPNFGTFVPCGSSPLARGLQDTCHATHKLARIIPARAGFTSSLSSSVRSFGIIPARAGFTQSWCSPTNLLADHPRSRGVYPDRSSTIIISIGSSPLARGLRDRNLHRGGHRRIIPARAGFTRPHRPTASSAADHPRSRGVYLIAVGDAAELLGSSPLARGLRGVGGLLIHPHRIIPARAGFTPQIMGKHSLDQDHPRSRGVYRQWVRRLSIRQGSSPLARGLPALRI